MLAAALILAIAVMLPDYVMGISGIDFTNLPSWAWWINALYMLCATIAIFYRYAVRVRTLKDPDGTMGYAYGSAFGFMMFVAVVSSIAVSILTVLLRNYICPEIMEATIERNQDAMMLMAPNIDKATYLTIARMTTFSLFWVWLSSLFSMLFLGGMGALISAAYVKRNPKLTENIDQK